MDSTKSITLRHNKAFIYSIEASSQKVYMSYIPFPRSLYVLHFCMACPKSIHQTSPYPSLQSFYILHFSIAPPKMDILNLPLPRSPRLPDTPLLYVIRKVYTPSLLFLYNQNLHMARSTVVYHFTINTY